MKYLYGVFVGSKWGMVGSLRAVRDALKRYPDAEVYRMRNYSGCPRYWDAPTFRVSADRIEVRP